MTSLNFTSEILDRTFNEMNNPQEASEHAHEVPAIRDSEVYKMMLANVVRAILAFSITRDTRLIEATVGATFQEGIHIGAQLQLQAEVNKALKGIEDAS